jgi:hypothetical protein
MNVGMNVGPTTVASYSLTSKLVTTCGDLQ